MGPRTEHEPAAAARRQPLPIGHLAAKKHIVPATHHENRYINILRDLIHQARVGVVKQRVFCPFDINHVLIPGHRQSKHRRINLVMWQMPNRFVIVTTSIIRLAVGIPHHARPSCKCFMSKHAIAVKDGGKVCCIDRRHQRFYFTRQARRCNRILHRSEVARPYHGNVTVLKRLFYQPTYCVPAIPDFVNHRTPFTFRLALASHILQYAGITVTNKAATQRVAHDGRETSVGISEQYRWKRTLPFRQHDRCEKFHAVLHLNPHLLCFPCCRRK